MEIKPLKELNKFIQLGARTDLKLATLDQLLSYSGNEEFLNSLPLVPELLTSLLILLNDTNQLVLKLTSLILVNISANKKLTKILINESIENNPLEFLQSKPKCLAITCLDHIFDPSSTIADSCCMILSNITRYYDLIDKIVESFYTKCVDDNQKEKELEKMLTTIFEAFSKFNKLGTNDLHYLGSVIENLSQLTEIRRIILSKKIIIKLFPFINFDKSIVRRSGVVGTIRNCCFEHDFHEYLLSEDCDILPYLLLPLAGNEEFDEEDNDKLPIELQYLADDKEREPDANIRCMLLEALTQLSSKRKSREIMREKNVYVILREYHKWETNENNLNICEDLVNILIRTEDEIGFENLNEIQIPDDVKNKLENENL